jgi:hypothetical protein
VLPESLAAEPAPPESEVAARPPDGFDGAPAEAPVPAVLAAFVADDGRSSAACPPQAITAHAIPNTHIDFMPGVKQTSYRRGHFEIAVSARCRCQAVPATDDPAVPDHASTAWPIRGNSTISLTAVALPYLGQG